MRAWFTKAIGCLIFVGVLSSQLAMPAVIMAQTNTQTTEYRGVVGGVEISDTDIAAAVESPTPNLANTTAYILLTITWILTGTVKPSNLMLSSEAVESQESAETNSPESYNNSGGINYALKTGGLVGGVGYYLSEMVRHPPATSSKYVAKIIQDSRLTPEPVYAQGFGIGFGALDPILETWAAFRDVAYFLLTVMFLIIGLLIIFRKKVSGNVAVSVQNALPRLVITLILITFSYAIAGFVVDLMFWAIYFVIFIFGNSLFVDNAILARGSLSQAALDTSIFHIFFDFFARGGAQSVADALAGIVTESIRAVLNIDNDAIGVLGGIFEWIITNIFVLIIGIAMLIQVFRVFFQLMMSYAGFVVNVVLSPFILLQGAWPGKNPFQKWFLNLLAGLAPFVVVIFMLFMAYVLAGQETRPGVGYNPNPAEQTGLRLPLIMTRNFNEGAMLGVLSIGFIMLLPEAVNMTKKFLGVSGGPFDELKDKAMGNLAKGWKGDQLIPGVGPKFSAKGIASAAIRTPASAAVGATGAHYAAKHGWLGEQWRDRAGEAALIGGGAGGLTGLLGFKKTLDIANKPFSVAKKVSGNIKDVMETRETYQATRSAKDVAELFEILRMQEETRRQSGQTPTGSVPGRLPTGSNSAVNDGLLSHQMRQRQNNES